MIVSIIVPVLNEADSISDCLQALQSLRQQGHELIVVDGGSRDGTGDIAQRYCDAVLISSAGRARQMNAGAEQASGDILLFLHADTFLPDQAAQLLQQSAGSDSWGRFDVRLSGEGMLLRIIEKLMNLRSRLTGIATGDQCMFIGRELYDTVGGYPDIALMEDIAVSKTLKSLCRPVCIKETVTTSSRRWESNGIIRTVVLMWSLRLLYFLGFSPDRLARIYR